VVLSSGSSQGHAGVFALRAALEARGESAGVFDGVQFTDLGGTQNPQGQYTRSIGGRFYHLEHVTALRLSPTRRSTAVNALLAVLGTPPDCAGRPPVGLAVTPSGPGRLQVAVSARSLPRVLGDAVQALRAALSPAPRVTPAPTPPAPGPTGTGPEPAGARDTPPPAAAAICTPRPPAAVTTTRVGPDRLEVTVAAHAT
jgi:hypothetical protein